MIYELDTATGYQLKSNFTGIHSSKEYNAPIRTNSEGLRDKEYAIAKRRGTFRILVLGDSLTFGYGVREEKSYPKVLEEMLNNGGIGKFEVINAGVPGFGTSEEYLYLKNHGLKYKPDLVIVGIYIGNDLDDNLHGGIFRIKDGRLTTGSGPETVRLKNERLIRLLSRSSGYLYLSQHSHLLNFLKLRIGSLIERYVNKGRSEKFLKDLYSVKGSGDTWSSIEITKLVFLEIDRLVKDNGAGVLFLMIPSPEQLDPGRFGFEGSGYDVTLPSFKLSEFCVKNGLDMIDLTPFLKGIGGVFYEREAHLTDRGHRLVGEVLFNEIKRKGRVH